MPDRKWYSAREASQYFGIPAKSILRYAATGRFPKEAILRIGRHVRLDLAAIEAARGTER